MNKYHEGKMKRTLERELKVLEIAEREAKRTTRLAEIAVGCCEPWAHVSLGHISASCVLKRE